MTNLLMEVRCKLYWLLSNVMGSEIFFFNFGFQFLQGIYEQRLMWEERASKHIQNEMNVCILNFVCNLNPNPEVLDALVSVKNAPRSQSEEEDTFYDLKQE